MNEVIVTSFSREMCIAKYHQLKNKAYAARNGEMLGRRMTVRNGQRRGIASCRRAVGASALS